MSKLSFARGRLFVGKSRSSAVDAAFVAGFTGKIVTTAVSLVIVAVAVRHLGLTAYGVVAVVAGLVNVLGFLDFGIGNSVISRVSAFLERGDMKSAGTEVTVAILVLSVIGTLVAMVGTVVSFMIPPSWIFDAPGVSVIDVRLSLVVFFVSVGMAIPVLMGTRICLAQELGSVNNAYLMAGTLLSLVSVLISVLCDFPVWTFVCGLLLAPNMALLIQTIWYTTRSRYAVPLVIDSVTWRHVKTLTTASGPFMVLGFCSAISYQTNVLIVAYVLDSAAAGVLATALRVYSLVGSLFLGGLQQGWASSARAIEADDMQWVRNSFYRVFLFSGSIVLILSLCVFLVGRPLISLWVGPELIPPWMLMGALSIWTVYSFVMTQMSFLLNSADIVLPQAVVASVMLCLLIPLSIFLSSIVGVAGPTLANLTAHALVIGIPTTVWVSRLLGTAKYRGRHAIRNGEVQE